MNNSIFCKSNLFNICFLFLGIMLVCITGTFYETREKKTPMAPFKFEHFNLGQRDVIADVLWIRLIQDIDYCENEDSKKAYNPSVTYKDALKQNLMPSRCNQGWVYLMLDEITNLSPQFRHAYYWGATALSVGVDDREGARLIFEKGIRYFPNYWQLAYAAAYHYLFEIQNPERAADLLLQANRYGGPSWLPVLASRLYSVSGRKILGKSVLEEYLKTQPGGEGEKRARERLEQINAGTSE